MIKRKIMTKRMKKYIDWIGGNAIFVYMAFLVSLSYDISDWQLYALSFSGSILLSTHKIYEMRRNDYRYSA